MNEATTTLTRTVYATLFSTLSSAFAQPFNTTVWLTSALPNIPKSFVSFSTVLGTTTATQELTTYTLAPR